MRDLTPAYEALRIAKAEIAEAIVKANHEYQTHTSGTDLDQWLEGRIEGLEEALQIIKNIDVDEGY